MSHNRAGIAFKYRLEAQTCQGRPGQGADFAWPTTKRANGEELFWVKCKKTDATPKSTNSVRRIKLLGRQIKESSRLQCKAH